MKTSYKSVDGMLNKKRRSKMSQKETHGTYIAPSLREIDVESREGLSVWWGMIL